MIRGSRSGSCERNIWKWGAGISAVPAGLAVRGKCSIWLEDTGKLGVKNWLPGEMECGMPCRVLSLSYAGAF